ncbi:unnamed protein product, partial [Allacma fusca]
KGEVKTNLHFQIDQNTGRSERKKNPCRHATGFNGYFCYFLSVRIDGTSDVSGKPEFQPQIPSLRINQTCINIDRKTFQQEIRKFTKR